MVTYISSKGHIVSKNEYGFPFSKKTERNLLILEQRLQGMTYEAISEGKGITRERVRQIITKEACYLLQINKRLLLGLIEMKL